MVFDPPSGHVLMFGGISPETPAPPDLWEWDGSDWHTRTHLGAPVGRDFMSLAPESTPGRYLMFGGIDESIGHSVDETWRFDSASNTWALLNPTHRPPVRYGHAMIPDAPRHRIVLFGGEGNWTTRGDTWEWDEGSEDWIARLPDNTPTARSYISGATDPATGRAVVYGGVDSNSWNQTFGDAWEWNGLTGEWRKLSDSIMPPWGTTEPPAMAYDAIRNRIVLWPAISGAGTIWEWADGLWTPVEAPYLGAIAMSLAFDGARVIAVMRGAGVLQTWTWDGVTWTRLADCPAAFSYQPMLCYDKQRGRVVLYSSSYRQTWEWDGSQWSQRASSGPSPRDRSVMAYDSIRGVTVLHGGRTQGGPTLGDTWVWNGVAWTNPTSGPVTYQAAMAFDPARARMLLVSSSGNYEWDGVGAWTQAAGSPWVSRRGGAAVYDEGASRVLLFGGYPEGPVDLSSRVTLIRGCVPCYANCDLSFAAPALNINDFQCFLNRFAKGDPYANCDHSTATPTLTAADFQCFLNQFVVGCP